MSSSISDVLNGLLKSRSPLNLVPKMIRHSESTQYECGRESWLNGQPKPGEARILVFRYCSIEGTDFALKCILTVIVAEPLAVGKCKPGNHGERAPEQIAGLERNHYDYSR